MVLGDGRERLVGDAPHQQDLWHCQVLIHPTLEFWAGVAEVSSGGAPSPVGERGCSSAAQTTWDRNLILEARMTPAGDGGFLGKGGRRSYCARTALKNCT